MKEKREQLMGEIVELWGQLDDNEKIAILNIVKDIVARERAE